MILETPQKHFDEDWARAKDLIAHASIYPQNDVANDIARAAWMFGVGALDAYFCDAFGDLLSRTLRAKDIDRSIAIPDGIGNVQIPASVVLEDRDRDGWKWRMAARNLIEKDDVLSIKKIKSLFNRFFPDGNKLFAPSRFERWIVHRRASKGLFGITSSDFVKLSGKPKKTALSDASTALDDRFEIIFHRRHDCIHNCDRPKIRPQYVSKPAVLKVLVEILFLVFRCHEEFLDEFPKYLTRLGFKSKTRYAVGCPPPNR